MKTEVAIVIPVYGHPKLVVDAIESALVQEINVDYKIVIVNDGCKHEETNIVCMEYSLVYPQKIIYLKKINGGLSSARNYGIDYIIKHFPTCSAIYFLDADNKIFPFALNCAYEILKKNNGVDWVYPSIDFFGMEWNGDYGGDYSVLIHTKMNICEAGSLVSTRIFLNGVRFDETFQLGWEDWDFFLTCASLGYKGVPLEDFGFQYRKRPESMLSNSNRLASIIENQMQKKHSKLFSMRSLAYLEKMEFYRYAVFINNQSKAIFANNIFEDANEIEVNDAISLFWKSIVSNGKTAYPSFICFGSDSVLNLLNELKLVRWVFLAFEQMVQTASIGLLHLKMGHNNQLKINIINKGKELEQGYQFLFLSKKIWTEVVRDKNGTSWFDSILNANPNPSTAVLEISIPSQFCTGWDLETDVRKLAVSTLQSYRSSRYSKARMEQWYWRESDNNWRQYPHEIMRSYFKGHPVHPLPSYSKTNATLDIGFILPILQFGGVEKVIIQLSQGFRNLGCRTHLVIVGSNSIRLEKDVADNFDTVQFEIDDSFSVWDSSHEKQYFGSPIPNWSLSGDHDILAAKIWWMDVVINAHGGSVVGCMALLRKFGIITINSLHLNDHSPHGRPVGNTFLGLAYEHSTDFFIPCSFKLGNWLRAMGVPDAKIVDMQNGPGFNIDRNLALQSLSDKKSCYLPNNRALRALFLGRLDRQKGISRLATLIKETKSVFSTNISWRVVGSALIDTEADIDESITEVLEQPINDVNKLHQLYSWADIIVIPSEYEGLPLTLVEALNFGVIPVTTDVGAIDEVINSENVGYMFSKDEFIEGALNAFDNILSDNTKRIEIAEGAYRRGLELSWEGKINNLKNRIDLLMEVKNNSKSVVSG